MKTLSTICVSVFALAATSCTTSVFKQVEGSGNRTSEVRPLGKTEEIYVTNNLRCIIEQGNPSQMVIEADDNVIEYITTQQRGGDLQVSISSQVSLTNSDVVVRITAPYFEEVKIGAGATVEIDTWRTHEAEVEVAQSGKFSCKQLKAESISLEASTNGRINVNVDTQELEIDASTGSQIEITGSGNQTEVDASTSSIVKLNSSFDFLDAKTTWGGMLYYSHQSSNTRIINMFGGTVSVEN